MYDDFRGSYEGHVGITQIIKYWGTVNNMKNELGLYINQESMIDKEIKSQKDFDEICKNYYKYLNENNIKSVTTKSIDENKDFPNYLTLNRKSKEFYNIPIATYFYEKYGITFGQRGHGKIFVFEDNETTVSHWEYDFSKFLRDAGFVYNKNYFRNINYSSFDDLYNGNMNCDYKIKVNNHIIYVELAGILSDKAYIEAYKNNTPLKSKSKEEYRQKLNQKREIFERNNLEYYILLPDEMNEETYKNILDKHIKVA
jgi:SOS response regulatory protein OraA/RecX